MIYFTPGPSQLYPTVKHHIAQALKEHVTSLSHRSKRYQEEIFGVAVDSLRRILSIPKSHHIFFLSSGTEAMERVIENCVGKYSFHFVNGAFSNRFYKTSMELKKSAEKHEVPFGKGFAFDKISIPKKTELICFTQNETSTGVALPISEIYKIKKQYNDKLIAIDIVSSVPYVDVDYKLIDHVFFSVQKGFGLPAGLGLIVISPQAFEKTKQLIKKNVNIGSYHNFMSLSEFAAKNQTPETPNVFAQYLLGKVLGDMLRIGIKKIRKETEEKAALLYSFFDKHPRYEPFVKDKAFRSKTVITVIIPEGSKTVIEKLKEKGIVVDRGYGDLKESQIRISNFPAHKLSDVKKLLSHLR